jgi:hypothetical protein
MGPGFLPPRSSSPQAYWVTLMSQDLEVVVPASMVNIACWQVSGASKITEKNCQKYVLDAHANWQFKKWFFLLLWYPVFVPQITGDPTAPGDVIEKASVVQWPTDPTKNKNKVLKLNTRALFIYF